ncbi:hypothetical protein EVAR_51235_1 [Eumeta japonica]|uniref:Uncharacterized protein n=1 Tax=Eumeta variegata TaxID=151549 RepID=A0A4C1X0W0_EUMVA|nr:hypothetical protein EVAR_51235_1 [Eumeta japonica]
MRATGIKVFNATHGHSRLRSSHQCTACLLDRNRMSNGGRCDGRMLWGVYFYDLKYVSKKERNTHNAADVAQKCFVISPWACAFTYFYEDGWSTSKGGRH